MSCDDIEVRIAEVNRNLGKDSYMIISGRSEITGLVLS